MFLVIESTSTPAPKPGAAADGRSAGGAEQVEQVSRGTITPGPVPADPRLR